MKIFVFHAQQAQRNPSRPYTSISASRFRYTHDLDELITGLQNEGIIIPVEVTDAALLTSYAWEARYLA